MNLSRLVAVLTATALVPGCGGTSSTVTQPSPPLSVSTATALTTTDLGAEADTSWTGPASDRSETGAVEYARQLSWFPQMLVYTQGQKALALTEANTTSDGYDQIRRLILDEVGPLRQTLAELPPGELWWSTAPLSHEVIVFDGDAATIEVWSVTIVARDGFIEPTANYATSRFTIVWQRNRWLLDSFSDEIGPAPATEFSAPRAALSDLTEGLDGHVLPLPPIFQSAR